MAAPHLAAVGQRFLSHISVTDALLITGEHHLPTDWPLQLVGIGRGLASGHCVQSTHNILFQSETHALPAAGRPSPSESSALKDRLPLGDWSVLKEHALASTSFLRDQCEIYVSDKTTGANGVCFRYLPLLWEILFSDLPSPLVV